MHCWSLHQEWMADEERPIAPLLIRGLIFSCLICQSLYIILITSELCSITRNDLKRQHCIFSICGELSNHSLILPASQDSCSIYGWGKQNRLSTRIHFNASAKQRHETESVPSVSLLWACSSKDLLHG